MGITNSNKQINVSQITCNETFKVTLALSAAPDIAANPTDIVLVLDRSGSMAGSPLANMKLGAKTFIDIIDEATDRSKDGNIGSGSHIGIVSFSDDAHRRYSADHLGKCTEECSGPLCQPVVPQIMPPLLPKRQSYLIPLPPTER